MSPTHTQNARSANITISMIPWIVAICIAATAAAALAATSPVDTIDLTPQALDWHPYGDRYAIIVMGGSVTGQQYEWFWADTYGMYRELVDQHHFGSDHIRFLAYGDSVTLHPGEVYGASTVAEITNAYNWAATNCTTNDLLYVFWVDHGDPVSFEAHDGPMAHTAIGTLTAGITAKQIIGAYNPCYSGAVIDDVSGANVISATSQNACNTNAWGWAGAWRRALRNNGKDDVDTNQDGHVSMTEAYNWVAPKSRDAGEHSMFDDNGDRVGHESNDPLYDPQNPALDGYRGCFRSLDGWADVTPTGAFIVNGDFEAGFYRDANDSIPNAWLKHETRSYEDSRLRPDPENGPSGPGRNSLYWYRDDNDNESGDWTLVRQTLDIEVDRYPSLRLDLDIKAISHNLGGSGWTDDDWEYPVTCVVYYRDDSDLPRYWQYGWYIDRDPKTDPPPNGRVVHGGEGIVYSKQVSADVWYAESFDLVAQLSTLAPPSRITEIRIGGSGWSFEGMADNLKIVSAPDQDPYIWIDPRDHFHDSFSNDGTLTGSIRLDVARDIGCGPVVPGDSLVADIVPVPGRVIVEASVTLRWSIVLNPAYGSLRVMPMGSIQFGVDDRGWEIWEGEEQGAIVTRHGLPVADRYAFDLPDGPAHADAPWQTTEDPLFYPGDILHYYIEAADDQAAVSAFPADISGFHDFGEMSPYPRQFTVRGLPTMNADLPTGQPEILVWMDTGDRSNENIFAFRNLGMYEGTDYDTYTTLVPTMGQSNGLGSTGSHGASPGQMAGYRILLYFCHDLNQFLISDGSNASGNDKSNDVDLLQQWHDQNADRGHAYFGDDLMCGLAAQGATTTNYGALVLGTESLDCDVGDNIGYLAYPSIVPTGLGSTGGFFATQLVVPYGATMRPMSDFDHIDVSYVSGPVQCHEFAGPSGPIAPRVVGGVAWSRQESGWQKATLMFPFSFSKIIQSASGQQGDPLPARARFLEEVLAYLSYLPSGSPIGVPPVVSMRLELHPNVPNPFNPVTEIRFTAPSRGEVTVSIYSLRGQKVATVFSGLAEQGLNRVVWTGTDERNKAVASGVYACEVEGFGQVRTRKIALVR